MGDTMKTYIANFLNSEVVTNKLSKSSLTSSLCMAQIVLFDRRKTNISIKNKKGSTALELKEMMDTVDPYNDGSELLPSSSESWGEEPPRRI